MIPKTREESLRVLKSNIQLLYEQRKLLNLLNENGIQAFVIGDSSVALFYPNPLSRELYDIDVLVHCKQFGEAVSLCKQNSYLPFELPEDQENCVHFIRNGITIHLLSELRLFSEEHKNEILNAWIASDKPLMVKIGNDMIPTLLQGNNGILQLVLLRVETQRGELKKRSLLDWMMFSKSYLSDENWNTFGKKAEQLGLKEFAKSITCYGKKYIDINASWCEWDLETLDSFDVVDMGRTPIPNEPNKTDKLTG